MKAAKKNNALEGIKKEQLKRRVFTLEFKAEVEKWLRFFEQRSPIYAAVGACDEPSDAVPCKPSSATSKGLPGP